MNQIVNKFLLAGDKFMPEMHLRQPGFTYIACGPFTRNKQRIQKFMQTGDTNYIYKNELDKACFQHDMAYGDFKDLARRTQSDIIKDNIWDVDLADRQLISKYNKGIRYLLCAIDLFSKYAFVVPLKDRKGTTIVNAFQSILDNSKRKTNKIWVDQDSEFYNTHFKKWLKGNNIEMYSTYNEGKSVVAERFIRSLKNKIYKHMTAISTSIYFDVLDDIVNEYNNAYHKTIKIKPIDVKCDSFAEYNEESNEKDPKFKVGDHVRISKCKHIFAKGYAPNWNEEIFVVKKIRNTVPWTYVISDLDGEEILTVFMKKNCKRLIKKNLEMKKY